MNRRLQQLLCRYLLQPANLARRLATPSLRPAAQSYLNGLKIRRACESLSESEKRDWILKSLRHAVRRAYAGVPYYRDLFNAAAFDPYSNFTFEDFSKVPILDRDDIRRAGDRLLSTDIPPHQVRKDATGGSTGSPTNVWTGPEDRGWNESGISYAMSRIGVLQADRKALLWGHHLDPVASDAFRDRVRTFADHSEWFDCLRLSPEALREYHHRLQQWRPAVVIAYASALTELARFVSRTTAEPPGYPTTCFWTGAEKLPAPDRVLIEQTFGRKVFERYGSRDIGLIAFQAPDTGNEALSIDWCNVLVEPEHRSEFSPLLVTKLHADAMPLIRYRIGDVARFGAGDRPGHPAFALAEVLGRETESIWLPSGISVHGIAFPHLFKDHPVMDFAVEQAPDYGVRVLIVADAAYTSETHATIGRTLRDNLPGINLEIRLVQDIPRTAAGKRRPVVSHVNRRTGE